MTFDIEENIVYNQRRFCSGNLHAFVDQHCQVSSIHLVRTQEVNIPQPHIGVNDNLMKILVVFQNSDA